MSPASDVSVKALLWKAWLIASILSLVVVTVAVAASGDLDTTFHGTGKYKLDVISGQYNAAGGVAIQSNGKIVTVGSTWPSRSAPYNSNIAVMRFTSLGALDTTFNATGKKIVDLGGIDQAWGVAIEPATGKLIVVGSKSKSDWSGWDAVVLRFNTNGTLDTTFNGTGKRVDDFGGGNNDAEAVALQPDGKIVTAGFMWNQTTLNDDFAVYRYTSAGALDTTFNGTGKVAISCGAGRNDEASAVVYDASTRKIIVAGRTCDSADTNCNFALARLNPYGSLDLTFSGDGKQVTDFGADDWISDIALWNGKIVAVGGKETPSNDYYAFARYTATGALDPTFAGTGKKVVDFDGQGDGFGTALGIQASTGKVVACGWVSDNVGLLRLTSAGWLDTSFHTTGKVIVDFGGYDLCTALAIQPLDGKYVLAGLSQDGATRHTILGRVLP